MSETESNRRSLLPVVIAIVVTSVMLLGLALLANSRRAAVKTAAPQLHILEPLATDSPLMVRFKSEQPLELLETGWGYRNLHLHAWVNNVQHMPATADLQQTDSAYVWTISGSPRGTVRLRLGWADQAHRPLRAGASEMVEVIVR